MDEWQQIQRVVIRDKHPVLEPELLERPLNRIALGVAAVALLIQVFALVQVLMGKGNRVAFFDHASFVIVAFLWLTLGLMVFLQRRAQYAGQLFLFSAAAGSSFLSLGTLSGQSLLDALIYTAGLLLFPPLMFTFSRAFTERRSWQLQDVVYYLPSLLLIWPMAQDFIHGQKSFLWRFGVASVVIYLFAASIQTTRDLIAARTSEQAAQTRALLFGLLAGTVPGAILFVWPLTFGNQRTVSTTWQPQLVLVFLLAMSYAVLLFEFSEADLIVRRGVIYASLTLVIVAAYGVLDVLLTLSNASVTSPGGGLSFVAVTVLLGAAFTPIRRTALRLVDWLLYGRPTDRWELLQGLSRKLSIVMPPEELGEALVGEVAGALNLRGAFLLRKTEEGVFALRHRVEDKSASVRRYAIPEQLELEADTIRAALDDPRSPGGTPMPLLLLHAKPLTAAKRETVPGRFRVLDDLGVSLTIPLNTRTGLEGVLCLQPKLAHDAFDSDDLELLAPVIRQATAALDNALLFSRLAEKVEELRHAYVRIAREQEAERGRLARELHDGTAQELAGLITLATVVERQLDNDGPSARTTLERLRHQAEDAYQGVRRASHALRPLMLDDFGLSATLERYLDQFREATGITVDSTVGHVEPLPDDVELALFRVAQECLENVRKHSGAGQAWVALRRQNGQVYLSVADNGAGLEGQKERGIGLAGMRERIEAVGGVIRVNSAPGAGVEIEAEIPVEEPP
jgi:signal transduction histidine kinase